MKKMLLVLSALALILVQLACGSQTSGGSTNYNSSKTITYSVSGSATSADITYNNGQGGTEQTSVFTNWSSETYQVESGYFAYISAQNQTETGSVTCSILLNGKTVKTSTSTGAYVIATCDGRVQ